MRVRRGPVARLFAWGDFDFTASPVNADAGRGGVSCAPIVGGQDALALASPSTKDSLESPPKRPALPELGHDRGRRPALRARTDAHDSKCGSPEVRP